MEKYMKKLNYLILLHTLLFVSCVNVRENANVLDISHTPLSLTPSIQVSKIIRPYSLSGCTRKSMNINYIQPKK